MDGFSTCSPPQKSNVIPAGFQLTPAELAEARTALDRVLEDNPEILPDRLVNVHLSGGNRHPGNDFTLRDFGTPRPDA